MNAVWVTRMSEEPDELALAFRQVGLAPVCEPVLQTQILSDAAESIKPLCAEDWLVLTSPLAIRTVAVTPLPRVAVVGKSSARLARARGFNVQFISPSGTAAGLWPALAALARDCRVCFPRSALAAVPKLGGVVVDAPILYRVEPRAFDVSVAGRVDLVAFTSPSGVHAVSQRLPELALPAVSIGPTTSRELEGTKCTARWQAKESTFDALAQVALLAVASILHRQ